MRKKIYLLTLINNLLIAAIFLSFQILSVDLFSSKLETDEAQILGAATTAEANSMLSDLQVSSEIINFQHNNAEGSYTVTYIYTFKNTSVLPIYDIVATTNLQNTFENNPFEIINLNANNLSINNSFNGSTIAQLLVGNDRFEAGEQGQVFLTVKFYTQDDITTFENFVNAEGILDYPDNASTDNGGTDSSNDSTTNTDGDTADDDTDGYPAWWDEYEDNLEPRTITLWIINADNNKPIMQINNGDVIDITQLPTDKIRLRAEISPIFNGSVRFELNENSNPLIKIENQATFDFAFDKENVGFIYDYQNGSHQLNVTLFSHKGAEGTLINSEEFNFTIINKPEETDTDTTTDNDTATSGSSSVVITIEGDTNNDGVVDEDDESETTVPDTTTPEEEPEDDSNQEETPTNNDPGSKDEIIEMDKMNPSESISENDGNILGVESETLANTGFNLLSSTIIGFIIMFIVLELNFLPAEERFFKNILKKRNHGN